MGDRLANPLWVVVVLLALAGLSLVAYALRALDLAGSVASFMLGLVIVWQGGLGWLALMVAFVALGVAATRLGRQRKERMRAAEANDGERGIRNVLANGAAAGLAALSVLVLDDRTAAALAFATAVAAVTADTLASEVGALARRARSILPPFVPVATGANGGISWLGQAAALGGAGLIAWLAVVVADVPQGLLWVPWVAGFAGCQLDSLLGATLEGDAVRDRPLSKEDVNFISSASPALVVLVAAILA